MGEEICPFCGQPTSVGTSTVFARAPFILSLTALVLVGAAALLFVGDMAATRMAGATLLVSWGAILTNIWPEEGLRPPRETHRVSVSLQTVRSELKAALGRANNTGDPARVSGDIVLLLWRLTLLTNANRTAPILFGRKLASEVNASETEFLRRTFDRLHALDGSWISSRLSQRPMGQKALKDLAALMSAAKAKDGTWVERLQTHGLGTPMPGVDIEAVVIEVREAGRELETRALAAARGKAEFGPDWTPSDEDIRVPS